MFGWLSSSGKHALVSSLIAGGFILAGCGRAEDTILEPTEEAKKMEKDMMEGQKKAMEEFMKKKKKKRMGR